MRRVRMSRGMMAFLGIGAALAVGAVITGRWTVAEVQAACVGTLPVAAAILLHELGHVLAARLCGVRQGGFRVSLFGARLRLRGVLSYRREWLVAAAGPAVNLLSAVILMCPFLRAGREAVELFLSGGTAAAVFALSSLALAGINLLPVRSLDGGRMLRCLLAPLCGERVADGAVTLGTALCLGTLWCLSVYALLRVGEMLSLFAFSLCLLGRMAGSEE